MKKKEPNSAPTDVNDQPGTRRERRRLLKTLVAAGGVLAAGKTLPDAWTRPMVEAIVLPSHAQMSPQSLSCSVLSAASLDSENDLEGPDGPFTGGDTYDFTWTDQNEAPYGARLSGVGAQLDTNTAGVPITLSLDPDPALTIESGTGGTRNTDGSGRVSFPDIDISIPGFEEECPEGNFGRLTLTFSADDFDDCVIDFTFSEIPGANIVCKVQGP